MAQGQMGRQWPGSGPPQPGYPAGSTPSPGYPPAAPQSGFPDPSRYQPSGFPDPSQSQQSGFPDPSQYQQPGFPDPSQYQQPGFPDPSHYQQPGSPDPSQHQESGSAGPTHEQSAAPPPSQAPQPSQQQPSQQQPSQQQPSQQQPSQQPGYYSVPQSGYQGQPWQSQPPPQPRRLTGPEGGGSDTIEGAIAEAVLGAATNVVGRAIGRRMRRVFEEKVAPAMAARQESVMRDRMVIAERHPDLRACLNDQVIFLAGGTRTMPLAQAMSVRTPEQSDALVAQLRG